MNEVDDAVRALYADIPPMTDQSFHAGRAQVQAMVESEPAFTVTVLDREAAPPTRTRRSRAAPLIAAAAAAALAIAGTIVLLPGDSAPIVATAPDRNAPLPPMPDRPLNPIGELADKVSSPNIKPGEFWVQEQTVIHRSLADGLTWSGPGVIAWSSHDGTKTWNSSALDRPVNGDNLVEEIGCKEPSAMLCGTTVFGPPPDLSTMPRDPTALYADLRNKHNLLNPDAPTEMYKFSPAEYVLWVLRMPGVMLQPDLRAALLRTLGYLPGVTVTKDARTTAGLPAIAVSTEYSNDNFRTEILFDPTDTRVLERRQVVKSDDIRSVAYRSGVVKTIGEWPN